MIRTLFTPRWLLALLVAVAFAVACVFLGRWQWGKYETKSARNAVIHANYGATPVPLPSVEGALPLTASGEWTRVTATGSYVAGDRLLVRNRVLDGTPGLEVLVPFELTGTDGSRRRVLVDRGWVQNADTAAEVPVVPAEPAGTVTVQGWLRHPEVDLGRDLVRGQLASINVGDAEKQVGPLLPTYLVLESERTADGTTPARPTPLALPDTDLGPNQAYAFQWWMFAAFGFVFYGYRIRVMREDRAAGAAERAGTAGPGPEGAPTAVPELVSAAASRTRPAARPPKPKKVRIWDEEDS